MGWYKEEIGVSQIRSDVDSYVFEKETTYMQTILKLNIGDIIGNM